MIWTQKSIYKSKAKLPSKGFRRFSRTADLGSTQDGQHGLRRSLQDLGKGAQLLGRATCLSAHLGQNRKKHDYSQTATDLYLQCNEFLRTESQNPFRVLAHQISSALHFETLSDLPKQLVHCKCLLQSKEKLQFTGNAINTPCTDSGSLWLGQRL